MKTVATVRQIMKQIAPRIGLTPKKHLDWIVKLATDKEPQTPGDLMNQPLCIAVFIFLERREALRIEHDGKANVPSQGEAEEIVKEWKKIIRAVINHESILKPRIRHDRIDWREASERYVEACDLDDWTTLATRALVDLVLRYGNLVKICRAPALRGKKKKDICGKWFVADRPNQDHCSSTCRSRAATKAKRARDRKK